MRSLRRSVASSASSLALCFASSRFLVQERQVRSGLDAALHARFRHLQLDLGRLGNAKGFFLMTSNLRKRKETKESCSVCLFDAWRQVWKWTGDRDSVSVWWAGCNFGREIISMISYIQPQTCKLAFACTIKIGADKASRWTSVASTWRCGFDCRCSNLETSYDWN